MQQVKLKWHMVIKCSEFDENLSFLKDSEGIYLWILQGNGNGVSDRVVYVGETTKSFAERHIDHFRNQLSGIYTVFNIGRDEDFKDFLKKYWDNKTYDEMIAERKIMFPMIWELEQGCFNYTFFDDEKRNILQDYLKRMAFAFGTVENTDGLEITYKEIEGSLIEGLRDFYCDFTGRRLKMKNNGKRRYRTDIPIGSVSQYPRNNFKILHSGPGLTHIPKELVDIIAYNKAT